MVRQTTGPRAARRANDYAARVDRVIDGDTFVATIDLGFDLTRTGVRIRLAGIDCPEIRGPSKERGDAATIVARDWIRKHTPPGLAWPLIVRVQMTDSNAEASTLGRYVAELIDPRSGESLTAHLLDRKHGIPTDERGRPIRP